MFSLININFDVQKLLNSLNDKDIKKSYNGSMLLFISSHLFLIAAISGFYFENFKVAYSLIIVYLTSIFYHKNGNKLYFITKNI